jgi:anti-anti-sigma factor
MLESGILRDAMTEHASALRITPRPMGESLMLRVEGRLTAATAPLFHSAIAAALRSNARALVIDVRGVTDMDAHGVGELVKAHTLGQRHNCAVRFLIRDGCVARLLRLANLDEVLTLLEESGERIRLEGTDERGRPH